MCSTVLWIKNLFFHLLQLNLISFLINPHLSQGCYNAMWKQMVLDEVFRLCVSIFLIVAYKNLKEKVLCILSSIDPCDSHARRLHLISLTYNANLSNMMNAASLYADSFQGCY